MRGAASICCNDRARSRSSAAWDVGIVNDRDSTAGWKRMYSDGGLSNKTQAKSRQRNKRQAACCVHLVKKKVQVGELAPPPPLLAEIPRRPGDS